MKRTLFYSWQSDLPNNTNRGFIESCLKKTIKLLQEVSPLSLELNIDRDTKYVTGTPDILESIFTKIARSKIFVADISIINSQSNDRKCPNPNVLIELGYAARVLGWERIFCIYNTDFGNISDLPFDLRQRRPIMYSLKKSTKEEARNQISKTLAESIMQLHRNGGLFDKIDDYFKEKVDTEILTIAGHLGKLIFGYNGKSAPELIQRLTNLSDKEIEEHILNSKRMGFQVFKNFNVHEQKFRRLADSAISSVYHNRELASPIIEFISWTARFDALNNVRNPVQWFKECSSAERTCTVLPPAAFQNNDKLPNRFILLKKLNKKEGRVIDFGDFPYKVRTQNLLRHYEFDRENIRTFISSIREFIGATHNWLDLTNGEFILDTFHHFELRPFEGDKLQKRTH